MSILFYSDRGEFVPISHFISCVLWSSYFLFLAICSFHVNLQSKCNPRYFTISTWGMTIWLIQTGGHWPSWRLNIVCDDLVSFTFIFHFWSHFSMLCRWSWRLREAIVGSEWVTNMAVSSTNVLRIVFLVVGRSDV